ncbi:MAG: 2-hydroxyacyl-CoA dehydratase family protein [Chloroflexota bacterium]
MSTQLPVKSALDDIGTLYQERAKRARELSKQGKGVVGYLCCFVPVEFLTALDLVPYRIQGSVREPITMADSYLETIMCPYVRSCFDLALKGDYEFLSGLVVPHSCDTIQRIYDIWRVYREPKYHHFINVPHMMDPSSYEFFRKELELFGRSLEKFTGQKLTEQRLHHAIRLHNQNRALLRGLYELRKQDPPLVSGTEVTKMLIAGMGLPVEEFNDLITKVIREVKERRGGPTKKPARVLLFGSEVDDVAFVQLVEASGANVVMDDLCTGSRSFWEDVDATADPWGALATRYLRGIHCPRTCVPQGKDRHDDLEARFGYLKPYIHDFNVNGVIIYIIRFCDTYELDAPDVREYLQDQNIRSLYIEDDYSMTTIGQLRTRVQAFLEMIA